MYEHRNKNNTLDHGLKQKTGGNLIKMLQIINFYIVAFYMKMFFQCNFQTYLKQARLYMLFFVTSYLFLKTFLVGSQLL